MLIEIYLLFWVIAFVLMLMSFFYRRGEMLLIPFLSASFFFFIGITSYNIEINHCESNIMNYINQTFPEGLELKYFCSNYVKIDTGLGTLSYGLGILMLIYAIYSSITKVGESVK
jgi:predicted neutral ceramidase superfamily lipid hydrolase